MLNFRRILLTAAAALSLGLIAAPSFAQMIFAPSVRDTVGLTQDDIDKMKEALRSALEQDKVGATADWTSSDGSRAGKVTVLDLFQKKGWNCETVRHEFTAGGGKTYELPFCKVDDGSWKIAF